MKIPFRAKWTLFVTLVVIYTTGAIAWILENWFLSDTGLGPEPTVYRTLWLQAHALAGLWFMVLFGYLFHSHIQPAWTKGKKLKSGGTLTGVIVFLFFTVPVLYYSANEQLKNVTAWMHTYIGLVSAIVFFVHYFTKTPRRRR